MSEGESQPPMTALSLDVMVPCDERYLPMLQQLAVRAVDYFAFSEDVRASLAQAIACEQLRSGAGAVVLGREDTHGVAEFCELTQPLP